MKMIVCAMRGRYNEDGTTTQQFEPNYTGCTNTITTVAKDNLIIEIKSRFYSYFFKIIK